MLGDVMFNVQMLKHKHSGQCTISAYPRRDRLLKQGTATSSEVATLDGHQQPKDRQVGFIKIINKKIYLFLFISIGKTELIDPLDQDSYFQLVKLPTIILKGKLISYDIRNFLLYKYFFKDTINKLIFKKFNRIKTKFRIKRSHC